MFSVIHLMDRIGVLVHMDYRVFMDMRERGVLSDAQVFEGTTSFDFVRNCCVIWAWSGDATGLAPSGDPVA